MHNYFVFSPMTAHAPWPCLATAPSPRSFTPARVTIGNATSVVGPRHRSAFRRLKGPSQEERSFTLRCWFLYVPERADPNPLESKCCCSCMRDGDTHKIDSFPPPKKLSAVPQSTKCKIRYGKLRSNALVRGEKRRRTNSNRRSLPEHYTLGPPGTWTYMDI